VVLAGAVTKALGDVVFLTKPRWAEVAARMAGVRRVVQPGEPLPPVGRVVDLQRSLSSWRARRGAGAPVRRVRRHDLRRRARVWAKLGAPPPSVVQRYADAAGVAPAAPPWIDVEGPRDALLLCVGAAWATKRWPAARFTALGRAWDGPVHVLGGPRDGSLVRGIADGIGPRAHGLAEAGFAQTLARLGHGARAVGGDTGLTHLCLAAGIPTVGVFGPTTADDGFWHWDAPAVQRALPCRPCSRHGGERCPIGDHACLEGLPTEQVLAALDASP
jgi:heptosyltransferase II